MTTSGQAVRTNEGAQDRLRLVAYPIYVALISLVGLALVVLGSYQFPSYEGQFNFVLLVILAAAAQSTATLTFRGIDFTVSSAISLAAVPLFGPAAAVIVSSVAEISLWVISIRSDRPSSKLALQRLSFNIGMNALSIFAAGLFFMRFAAVLGENTWAGRLLPWVPAAVIADQLNLWLLIGVLYLQRGVSPLEVWRENKWAVPISVITTSIGGGLLAVAVRRFDYLGIAVFFLPIILSAYAFRIYVRRTEEQMAKLEDLIELRTQALSEANAALSEANEELANLHKEKDAFLGVLTHDMRTPLTTIHGFVSLLRDRDELGLADRDRMLQIIQRNGQNLLEMVNNILEIRQLQVGRTILLERENFDLAAMVIETVESLRPLANEKKIRVENMVRPDPVFTYSDKAKVQRVVMNLISNALKYTSQGGSVAVDLRSNNRTARFEVADTGYGIPAEDLPHIFESFHRVRKHEERAVGTGLGLAIVKSLVEAHEGTISVTSEEGQGSKFSVVLPL